jgi:hypothetical protein
LNELEKNEILERIISQKDEEKQVKMIIKHIDKLGTQHY